MGLLVKGPRRVERVGWGFVLIERNRIFKIPINTLQNTVLIEDGS